MSKIKKNPPALKGDFLIFRVRFSVCLPAAATVYPQIYYFLLRHD
jgi:hypothetical protein